MTSFGGDPNLNDDPRNGLYQHGMMSIHISIVDLGDQLWPMQSVGRICHKRPSRGDPREPGIGNPRGHMLRHPTRMGGGDCDICFDILMGLPGSGKSLKDHPDNQPNHHGMMVIQIIYVDLDDHLRGRSKSE